MYFVELFVIWFIEIVSCAIPIKLMGTPFFIKSVSGFGSLELIIFWLMLLAPLGAVLVILSLGGAVSFRFNRFFSFLFSVFIHFLSVMVFICYWLSGPCPPARKTCFGLNFLHQAFVPGSKSVVYSFFLEVGYDQISILFILLTTFLIPICFLCSWESISQKHNFFYCAIFIVEFLLIGAFSAINAFIFYIFFEATLIPIFLLIGVWGSGSRRSKAAYYFFFFTLLGSMSILFALFYLAKSSVFNGMFPISLFGYDEAFLLRFEKLSSSEQTLLFFALFIGLAVKIPMLPFHTWLPEAHVEAPTAGSVLLAGILLKLGGYGLIRFMPFFPLGIAHLKLYICVLAILSILYSSLAILVQVDLKRIVAYSSIAHMNYAVLGLFADQENAFVGSVFSMISHGLVSSVLFICIGFLYERYGTRSLAYYGGLAEPMPVFSFFLFLFVCANLSVPGTSSFIGEFFIFAGIMEDNWIIAFFALLSIVFSGVVNIWLFNRLAFGPLKTDSFLTFVDLSSREFFILLVFTVWIFVLGLFPDALISIIEAAVATYFK